MRPVIPPQFRNKPGHYVPGIIHEGILYVSGQLAIDPKTGHVPDGGIRAQTRQALANVDAVLQEAGVSRKKVIMCRLYIPDITLWDDVNEEYAAFFGEHRPARAVIPTKPLHHGCLVEIEATAALLNNS